MESRGNINFVLVGARATGKTVYLTSLYLNEKRVTAQDGRTIEYLKPLSETLLNGEYPSATSGNLHELMFNYKDETFSSSMQIDDVDGYFIETLSEKDKNTQTDRDTLIENLKLSEGIIFFFPYEKIFNENSIKEFNYQIDTIVSKLKEMYEDRNSIPIPAVIAVSKWDNSQYYKEKNEDKKALEYIDSHRFLRLAKDKIEQNFTHIKIVPLSAIGENIHDLRPYNLHVPIEFFLKETYTNWVKKISTLKDDKEELLSFLATINFDMKQYDNGKYDKLYKELESEYAEQLLKELKNIKNIKEYQVFEEKNQLLIDALFSKNKDKISNIKNDLQRKKKIKHFSGFSLVSSVLIATVLGLVAWNANKLLIKSETELFADISTEYTKGNYEDAFDDIEEYLTEYKDTVNLEHKQKVIAFKSDIRKIQKKAAEKEKEQQQLIAKKQKEILEKKQKAKIIADAQQMISDSSFNNIDKIDEIYASMNEMEIDKAEIKKQLLEKKESLLLEQEYRTFKGNLERLNFEEALSKVETDWKEEYGDRNQVIVRKILDRALNKKVEHLLKDISDIVDIDAFNALVDILNKITSLKENTTIEKINYQTTLNSNNESSLANEWKKYHKYTDALEQGVYIGTISFGAEYQENEPLGFQCGGEDEIILYIDSAKYHFDYMDSCRNQQISWRDGEIFHATSYTVKVIEEDTAFNDEYRGSFSLSKNNLIKLYNGGTVKKDIGKAYFVELGK